MNLQCKKGKEEGRGEEGRAGEGRGIWGKGTRVGGEFQQSGDEG